MSHPLLSSIPFPRDSDGRLYDPRVRGSATRAGLPEQEMMFEATAAIRLAAKRMHLWVERWAEAHGLSEGRFQVLALLHHLPEGRAALGELAEMLGVAPRTVTGLIDNLERDGLVARVPDPSDRRSVQAQLTASGRERIGAMRQDAVARQTGAERDLSEEQWRDLRHLCLVLVEGLDRINNS